MVVDRLLFCYQFGYVFPFWELCEPRYVTIKGSFYMVKWRIQQKSWIGQEIPGAIVKKQELRQRSRNSDRKGPPTTHLGGFSTAGREPLEYEVMVRSTYRLSLIFPVLLLSVAAYAQPAATSQTDSASKSQQQQTQRAATTPSQIGSSQSEGLPDDPGTTAHVQAPAVPDGPIAVFDTSMGRMTCGLFSKEAPATAANFIGLATGSKTYTDLVSHQKVQGKPLYDGTTFHRVIPGFMIQGGDPTGTGSGDPGYFVNDEIVPNLN